MSTITENNIRLQMILQQEKTTKSLDNLFAVKNWSCILLAWSTSNTNELYHPKIEKCFHHTADQLKQGVGFQEAAEVDAEILYFYGSPQHAHKHY